MIIHTEPPESKEISNRSLVDACEKDAAEEMEIENVDYIKFGPHRSISKDNKMELAKQLANLIASHEHSEVVQKLILSSTMAEYNPIAAKANQIKRSSRKSNRTKYKIQNFFKNTLQK